MQLACLRLYLRLVTITRRTVTHRPLRRSRCQGAAAARRRTGSRDSACSASYSDANLEFVKSEGFTSMELRLDPDKLDDAAIAAMKDKIAKAGILLFRRSPAMGTISIRIRRSARNRTRTR